MVHCGCQLRTGPASVQQVDAVCAPFALQAKALMTADGKPPAAGQLQHNRDLAATFRRLAEHGAAKGEARHSWKARTPQS